MISDFDKQVAAFNSAGTPESRVAALRADMAAKRRLLEPDFTVSNEGSIFLVRPRTEDLRRELSEKVDPAAQWMCNALVVEHRYVADLVQGLRNEGYSVA